MSNFFNFKRAANFFVYDLNTAKNNFLLSLVICGLIPAISFVFAMLFSLLSKQSPADFSAPLQIMSVIVGTLIAVVNFPTKQYGPLTDKRYGSDWLMLPASSFEKWLSMVLISCVVFPVSLFVMMLSCDWLLSVIFPSLYPDAIISSDLISVLSNFGDGMNEFEAVMPHVNLIAAALISFSQTVLFFVLGAVFFKQSKFAKSLLVLFALSTLISIAMATILGSSSFNQKELVMMIDEGNFAEMMNKAITYGRILDALGFILIGGGLYYRIKTLKH